MKIIVAATLTIFLLATGFSRQKSESGSKQSQVISGYLVDRMCGENFAKFDLEKATQKAAKHTKECAIDEECKKRGYGIVTKGRFFAFDEKGNNLAAKYFDSSKKISDFLVDVQCTVNGDQLSVVSVRDSKAVKKKSSDGLLK
jgi:hypothetical protein